MELIVEGFLRKSKRALISRQGAVCVINNKSDYYFSFFSAPSADWQNTFPKSTEFFASYFFAVASSIVHLFPAIPFPLKIAEFFGEERKKERRYRERKKKQMMYHALLEKLHMRKRNWRNDSIPSGWNEIIVHALLLVMVCVIIQSFVLRRKKFIHLQNHFPSWFVFPQA